MKDGRALPVTSRRQRAVIAALALHPGQSVSPESLVDAVWGEDPPAGARTTVQTYVSRLRRSLGADAIVHGSGGYQLADGTMCDAAIARGLAAEARASLSSSPDRAAELARQALDMWEGRSLAEFADEDWFMPEAIGLEELRANLVDIAAEGLIDAARSDEAVELLEPVTLSDPLREPSHVLLVDALLASGRGVEAVRTAERYRRRLRDETGLEPSKHLVAAEQRALAGEAGTVEVANRAAAAVAVESQTFGAILPRPGRLFGREADLDQLSDMLATERLVTISGPGGVGKTRLAAELSMQLAAATRTIVVELAPVQIGEVIPALGASLQLRSDHATVATIAEHLRGPDTVLVIDNAEHVIDEVRDITRALLDRCAALRLLVTGRTRLDLPDEHLHVLGPLSTSGEQPPAVDLFVDRLARSGPLATFDHEDHDIREVCERLDGVPLAIELAAGRAAALGVNGLRGRLDAALDLIAAGPDDDRHASLRRVVAWSYEMLDAPSRRLLAALSMFEGEFDLIGAEQVGSAVLGQPVSLLISRLVDASLVSTSGVGGRYRLLEMIRQYGREQLTATDLRDARRAHARWVGQRLTEIAAATGGPDERTISTRLDQIRDEIRGALRWAPSTGDPKLWTPIASALAGSLLYRPDAELIAATNSLVRHLVPCTSADSQPPALTAAGARLAFLAGDLEQARELVDLTMRQDLSIPATRHRAQHARGVLSLYDGRHDEAVTAFKAVDDDDAASTVDRLDALGGLGLALCYAGRLTDAQAVVDRARAIARTIDSDTYRAFTHFMQGEIDMANGDVETAIEHLRKATDQAWAADATFVWGIAATVLAAALVRHRSVDEARSHLPELVERWRRTATWTQLWTTLRLIAELLCDHGDDETAAIIFLAADRDPAAPRLTGEDQDRHSAIGTRIRDHLGEAALEGITAGVDSLERMDVLERALDALEQLDAC